MMRSSSSFEVENRSPSANPFDPITAEPVFDVAPTAPIPARARLIVRMLQKIRIGSLTVRFPDGHSQRFGQGRDGDRSHAEIVMANWKVCEEAFKSGDIGFGATYIAGDWTTPDLTAVLNGMVANRNVVDAVFYGTWWGRLLFRARHLMRRNTRSGSKKNIHAHYDIGNAFYRLWLDESMTYSAALFADGRSAADSSPRDDFAALPDAQRAKYDRVLDQLALPAGARVLEIGCGWGGLAERAAERGLHVTGLTLSSEQLELARQRIGESGHDAVVDFQMRDYRDVAGQYDGIVSIEMFEAVGERYWGEYFECIRKHLKPGGRATVQTITIAEHLFADYRTSSDFIQQYIFPGGMLPTASAFEKAAQAAGLRVVDRFAFGQHYARTLAAWLGRFDEKESAVRACGFDTAFIRTWRFYLAYCIAAFRFDNTDVMQFTLEHEGPAAAGVPCARAA